MLRCLQNALLSTLLRFSNVHAKKILARLKSGILASVQFDSMAENSIFKSGLNFISRQADRVVSPEARNEAYQRSDTFARDQPFTFVSLNCLTCHV